VKTEDLKQRFAYHKPTTEVSVAQDQVRTRCFELALFLNDMVPDSRELSLALADLERVMFWGTEGIARKGVSDGMETREVTPNAA